MNGSSWSLSREPGLYQKSTLPFSTERVRASRALPAALPALLPSPLRFLHSFYVDCMFTPVPPSPCIFRLCCSMSGPRRSGPVIWGLLVALLLNAQSSSAILPSVPRKSTAASISRQQHGPLSQAKEAWERVSRVLVPAAGAAEPQKKKAAGTSQEAAPAAAAAEASTAQLFVTGMLSGAIAGMSVDLTLFPLDTIKTRLQAAASSGPQQVKGLFEGMYDGIGPAIVASAPACAAFFGAYDTLKRRLAKHIQSAPLVNLLAAAGGDLTQSVVRVPFEVVKQRLQAGVDKTWQEAVSSIMQSRGPRGFYTGWGALALRDLPFDIIEFPLYEALKDVWAKHKGSELETWESSFCGSLAGGIAAGLTTPLDVVKTRLMTQKAGSSAAQYKGLLDCLVRVAREEGGMALFKGIGPRVINISLGGAIFFGAYEAARKVVEPAILKGELGGVPADLGARVQEWWAETKEKAKEMKALQRSRGRGGATPAHAK